MLFKIIIFILFPTVAFSQNFDSNSIALGMKPGGYEILSKIKESNPNNILH